MKPFELDLTKEAVEQEQQVIGWFRDNRPKNAKVLLQRVRMIYDQVPDFIQNSFCNTILSNRNRDKMKLLDQFIYEMDNVPRLIDQLKREGCHGMVIHKGQFYGVSLKANPKWLSKKDAHLWTPEQEDEICNEALDAWMIEHRIRHFTEKVVLFSEFGFSGVSRLMDVQMSDVLWAELERKHTNDELRKYLNM